MNKNLYRIIFNKARGLLMVVSEINRGQGKSGANGVGHTLSQLIGRMKPTAFLTMTALGLVTLAPQTLAAGIVADKSAPGGQQPNVMQSANGTPQVNIQTPSAGGVSHNKYTQFDVDNKGAILNNSHKQVQTQMGGWVAGNPWLAKGEAKIILNEVNSRDPSKLNGYVEVAGRKAQVVIANPAGISCDGCGFINANRATLTTGTPQMANGELRGYRVGKGEIVVEGAGMDSSRQDYTDLIARTVKVNAGIWAKDVAVTTGKNEVAADNSTATASSATDSDSSDIKPTLAIDVAQLGGMYAGKIRLVATEQGVGVSNKGTLGSQAGDITINANGDIVNSGTVNAGQDLLLGGKKVDNSGTLFAQRDQSTTASDEVTNTGLIAAKGNTHVRGASIRNSKGAAIAAGMKTDGTLADSGNLTLASDGKLTSRGQALAGGNLNASASQIDLSGSDTAAHHTTLTSSSDIITDDAQLLASGDLKLSAAGKLSNDRGVINANALQVSTPVISNRGGQLLQSGDSDLQLSSDSIDNQNGRIAANAKKFSVQSASLNNQGGTIMAAGSGSLNVAASSELNNQNGTLAAASDLAIATPVLNNNQGQISANKQLTLDQQNSSALARTAATSSDLRISNEGGRLVAGQQLTFRGREINGSGEILSLGDMDLSFADGFSNNNKTLANGDLTLNVNNSLINTALLGAGGKLNVQASNIDNQTTGELSSQQTTLNASDTLSNRGLIDGVLTRISASTVNNIGTGRIYGDGLAIGAATLNNLAENNSSATIAARQRLDLGIGTLNNRDHSLIYSNGDIAIGGALDADALATGKAGEINNHSSTIESVGNMALSFTTLNNINDNFATSMVQLSQRQKDEYMVVDLNNGVHYSPDDYNISFYKNEVRHICIEGVVCGRDHYYQYSYTETISEEQIAQSDPAKIIAGGQISLSGDKLLNDKSQIIAGGTLLTVVKELVNTEVTGQKLTEKVGQVIEWDRIHKKGKDSQKARASAYTPPTEIQSISLSPTVMKEHTQATSSAPSLAEYAAQRVEVAGQNTDVIRSMTPDASLPTGSLFTSLPDATSSYLIETDPRFTNQRIWLSSDYMLRQLQTDPSITQKRLGDGFYEQRLVREQIVELVGQRYLADYTSDEEQYKGLMEAGVSFAKKFNLVPGVALTAEQMKQITQDMVWLVAQDVKMPDGTTQNVLVPQVYAQVQQGDMDGSGALLAGKNVSIGVSGGMLNSGRISATQLVSVSGDDIVNVGGIIAGKSVSLQATNDITNTGGTVRATDTLLAQAGRDITVASETNHAESQNGSNNFSRDNIDRVAGMYVQGDDGKLLLQAGRDVNLQASQVVSSGENSQTQIAANRDITMTTVTTSSSDKVVWDKDNHVTQTLTQVQGSEVTSDGNISLNAGNNINAQAAKLNADRQLALTATNDINLGSASSQEYLDMNSKVKGSGFLSKRTTTTRAGYDATLANGSSLGGENISVSAGNNLNITGSDVAADQGLALRAGNDLNVTAAEESRDSWSMKKTTKSGLMSSGGIGFFVGSIKESSTSDTDALTHNNSTLGSVNGDTSLVAGNNIAVQGSDVIAGNDINMVANNITIDAANNQSTTDTTYERKQTGLTLALSGAIGSAINAAYTSAKAADEQQDGRMASLQKLKSGLAGVQAAQAAVLASQNTADQNAIGVSLSLSTSKSKSESHSEAVNASGSTVQAGNNINLVATGSENGNDGDLTIGGSQLKAGNDVLLSANRDINLLSAQNTQLQTGKNSSSGGGVGISIGAGQGGAGISVFANASKGSGNENGDGLTHTETTVDAGNKLTVNSGRDTTLRGAQLSADQVVANVGRDLTLQSEQDVNNYDSKQKNSSAGASFTFGSMTGSVSASVAKDKIHSTYNSVQEQTGIFAGDGGFDITVGNHTQLDGAVIGSTASEDKNRLDTGTLGFSNIDNSAEFEVSHSSVGISTGGLGAQDLLKNAVQNLAANGLGAGGSDGNASGTTYAAVSPGSLIIRDQANQQQDVSTLSRDVEHANQSISPIFDKAKEQQRLSQLRLISDVVNQGVDITLSQGQIMANNAGIKAAGEWDETKETRQEYWDRVQNTAAYKDINDQYKAGGELNKGIRAAAAAITALAGGDPLKALAQGAAPYLSSTVRDLTLQNSDNPTAGQIAANAIGHAIVGGVVAELSGSNATAGAVGAAGGELAARAIVDYLYPGKTVESLSDAERAKVSNLASLAATMAAGLATDSSAGAVAGHDAGKNAVDYNLLSNKYGVEKLSKEGRALYEKLKAAGIGGMDELQERFTACGSNGKCQTDIRNEYRKLEKEAGEKLVAMYKSGAITADEFGYLVTDYARTMMYGARDGQLDSDYSGFIGDIYTQTGIDWTPMGIAGNPYVAAIKGSEQLAEWKAQGLSDEKIRELALKNDIITSAMTPVDVNGILSLYDNGASAQEVVKFAAGMAFNKVVQRTQSGNKGTSGTIGTPATTAKNPLSPVQQRDVHGNEIVYRTMSPEQFRQFERTGVMPATTETSVSPVLSYSSKYDGITVKITVKPGTFSELEKIGIAANSAAAKELPNMSTQTGKWMETNTRFKVEGGQMTTQLGQGKGMEIFNKNIVHFEQVK
ncbi:hemagglutinin repeat-containing protein [Pectobacterium brasiliense]|uniref:hemagglutinin repeat-containing protein n=1 Tax=Pectobacterium brasiliense TaxID=180957 RepID=UPI0015DD57C5|nr:hemagglutinin repeat-containing protein [Pectobacterium brasiliense]MBA0194983.1 hemagglutinin repeat-containing protein [Pectobacterium brasiliense]MBN3092800.1 hemagglutinin repeat-containing protein [Pectobacterium brasiliense]MBN3141552.1 hemagglutinin repeat-containing protein [Pectobacterium brasiliense]MBW5897032.1 hemagglutinin repeat-containing protein [Pectobacterium brasiliense]